MATPYTGDTRRVRAHNPAERYHLLAEAEAEIKAEGAAQRLVYLLLLGASAVGAIGLVAFNFVILAAALLLVAAAIVVMLFAGEV